MSKRTAIQFIPASGLYQLTVTYQKAPAVVVLLTAEDVVTLFEQITQAVLYDFRNVLKDFRNEGDNRGAIERNG